MRRSFAESADRSKKKTPHMHMYGSFKVIQSQNNAIDDQCHYCDAAARLSCTTFISWRFSLAVQGFRIKIKNDWKELQNFKTNRGMIKLFLAANLFANCEVRGIEHSGPVRLDPRNSKIHPRISIGHPPKS